MGYVLAGNQTRALITEDYRRRKSDRLKFIPAKINADFTVSPVEFHGSAHINALIEADAMILMPIGVNTFKKGDTVDVRRF